jgi:hypothetical protein
LKNQSTIFWLALLLLLAVRPAWADSGAYRQLGYQYLSPLPGAEYSSPQTKFVLLRFQVILPTAVTNLSQCIQVIGTRSGIHAGQTKIASDDRTVIFQIASDFQAHELVTVSLNPLTASGAVQPFQYQFMISDHMPDSGIITARGENPPLETRDKAFDNYPNTKWLDLVVPNGSTNFSWIQFVYPGGETHVVNQYSITSANDAPERDPQNWRIYGVDGAGGLTLLDTRTNQVFGGRMQKVTFGFTNFTAFRGYRLEITRVANPAAAIGVQLAELAFLEPGGSVFRQYWTGIGGSAVTDLTGNGNYPNNPSGHDLLGAFEAPTDWADNYGTRVRGFVTAPNTGSFVFWIASDDSSELWLSTNDVPANARRIAYVSGWTTSHEWNKYSSQKSTPINLIAGQKYYVEALQKEAAGGDNLAVGWAKPGQDTATPSEVIPGSVLTPWTGGNLSSSAISRVVTTSNLTQTAVAPQSLTGPAADAAAAQVGASVKWVGQGTARTNNGQQLALAQASPGQAGIMPNGVSVPSDFPFINITINGNPDPEYIFIDNRGGGGKNYNVIFDNSGSPVWYMKMPDERRDMKVQQNGVLTMLARTGGYRFVGLNTNYEQIAEYWAANGYSTDEHELQLLADGTYLLIGGRSQTMDMSRYISGGNPAASVIEQAIQMFTPAGDLILQWRSLDHLDILDQQDFIDIRGGGFDFPHFNAIDVDTDGNILISSRSISEVTKVNRDTGEIIWRLGGKHSDFAFPNDPLNGPRNQHAVRCVGTNRYTLFDNGNQHNPPVSRAVEYELNPTNMTAAIRWQYPPATTTALYSFYMGNAQRLSNGNTLINWAVGNLPKLTEVRPDGSKAFEMNWADGYEAYRVWRCPWQGVALKPNLIIESYPDKVLLLFNKFGDTNVSYYRVYGGTAPAPTNVLVTTPISLANLVNLENQRQYYFRVTAVDKKGVESDYSDEQSVFVDLIKPGENMVQNGDFSLGKALWIWTTTGSATAAWIITNGTSLIDITNAGTQLAAVQLRQAGLRLRQGSEYAIEFDAWSVLPRAIEVRLGQDQTPFATYKVFSPSLTTSPQHFTYYFTMANVSDFNARLMFNVGASTRDVYLDNVSLRMVAQGDFNRDRCVNDDDLKVLTDQWLQQGSGLSADLNGDGVVDFQDFAIFGENWSGGNCPW